MSNIVKAVFRKKLVVLVLLSVVAGLCLSTWVIFKVVQWRGIIRCYGGNGKELRLALYGYAEQNGRWPTCEEWPDVLINEYKIERKFLKCPGDKGEWLCSYALNKYIAGTDVGIDTYIGGKDVKTQEPMVLLFESKEGWNQPGGPELLNPDNHGGLGCMVVFTNYVDRFVSADEFHALRWKVNESEPTYADVNDITDAKEFAK